MSEEENAETARRALDDFNRRDKATWLLSQDPEVETHPPKAWPENAPIHGAEACWDFYVENTNAFEAGGDFDVVELIKASGDKVVVNQRQEMRGKSSGVGVVFDFWLVLTFRKGKIVRGDWFTTRAEALEAAGLSE